MIQSIQELFQFYVENFDRKRTNYPLYIIKLLKDFFKIVASLKDDHSHDFQYFNMS